MAISEPEQQAWTRLGIPSTAREVVVVAESSHWDPNWLLSSEQYYRWCVRPSLDRALDELAAEPRRIFSLECLFFVDRYWRDRPQRQAEFRELVNQGRLRFTGCGVTTPDTLLPEEELLLRDLLIGQEWLRERGMTQEPALLYLPDSFGHSPELPSLLVAAGISSVAVCRIDGMRFPGADLEAAANFPRSGSSAAQLIDAATADFVWRASDGSEVVAHWMSHTYGHGDMIASGGISRALGLPVSWPDRRSDRIDRRVEGYLADLRPLARTPYRLLAIGFDFVRPVPRLVELLDAWNDRHHEATGTWLVNAAIDDYLGLVAAHREALPVVDFDPNPYWMGFYATRPDLKRTARDLGRRLIATDAARVAASLAEPGGDVDDRFDHDVGSAWWTAATSNHHDFVTGTAPDRVARGEQTRWLAAALAATPWPTDDRSDAALAIDCGARASMSIRRDGRLVIVVAPWGTATFDPHAGGSLVRLASATGVELLSGPSLELAAYIDSGGLWRMGQELHGGRWSLADRSSRHHATVAVDVDGAVASVNVRGIVDGRVVTLHHTLRADDPSIVTTTSLHARARRTVTLVVRPSTTAAGVTMHQPGGVVRRPLRRWYEPTFWPLHSFASADGADSPTAAATQPLVVATASPTALHVSSDGSIEMVAARTAIKEIAFGVVPVMAPAWGTRWGHQEAAFACGWAEPSSSAIVERGRQLTRLVDESVGRPTPAFPVVVDDPGIEVTTVKVADRGDGVIVRLRDWTEGPRSNGHVSLALRTGLGGTITEAHLVDTRERDLATLRVDGGRVGVPITRTLTTVRLSVHH